MITIRHIKDVLYLRCDIMTCRKSTPSSRAFQYMRAASLGNVVGKRSEYSFSLSTSKISFESLAIVPLPSTYFSAMIVPRSCNSRLFVSSKAMMMDSRTYRGVFPASHTHRSCSTSASSENDNLKHGQQILQTTINMNGS